MTPAGRVADPDSAVLHDPATYVTGVPYDVLARLRAAGPTCWVAEPDLPGWPAGTGYHLVLRHAEVEAVLKDPATFSSALTLASPGRCSISQREARRSLSACR